MCTRNLKLGPLSLPRAGPLYHQYVCVGNSKTGYSCRGLGPTGNPFNSPGKLETDQYKQHSCQTVQPPNTCVEKCINKTFASTPPNYSVDLSNGSNCQTYADQTVFGVRSFVSGQEQMSPALRRLRVRVGWCRGVAHDDRLLRSGETCRLLPDLRGWCGQRQLGFIWQFWLYDLVLKVVPANVANYSGLVIVLLAA